MGVKKKRERERAKKSVVGRKENGINLDDGYKPLVLVSF